jgi:hypothetical protein
MVVEKNRTKYPIKQISNNKNNVPIGTKHKVYSAMVFPSNNCCLMMTHVLLKYVAAMNNKFTLFVTF